MELGAGVPRYDAVVHFAAIPAILIRPDNETFRINAISTYNVIDAAVKLGVRKVIFASSETTYGICFAEGEVRPEYVPVDEEHPMVPHDSYGMSKVVNEATARSFQARSGIDLYGLRINNVIEPHEYETKFPGFVADPGLRRRNIFAYIDARDLGHMVDCCLRTDGLGYEIFNVSNDDTSVGIPSDEVYACFYAGVVCRCARGCHETFYANDKAKRLVGFAPRHSWRNELGEHGRPIVVGRRSLRRLVVAALSVGLERLHDEVVHRDDHAECRLLARRAVLGSADAVEVCDRLAVVDHDGHLSDQIALDRDLHVVDEFEFLDARLGSLLLVGHWLLVPPTWGSEPRGPTSGSA